MIKTTRQWDIRCPDALKLLLSPRRGYWFKVNREKAQEICDILCVAYGIRQVTVQPGLPPTVDEYEERANRLGVKVKVRHSGRRYYGLYCQDKIWVHGRAHVKSVFHEWYHHLDKCTRGKYDSNDHQGGPSSYGWQFGDRMFAALKEPLTTSSSPSVPVE